MDEKVIRVWVDYDEGYKIKHCRKNDLVQAANQQRGDPKKLVLLDVYEAGGSAKCPEISGRPNKMALNKVFRVNPPKQGGLGDMTGLTYLEEPNILDNLWARYCKDKIYTCIQDILIVINPYKKLTIYGKQEMEKFRGASETKRKTELEPHIYSVSERAYQLLTTGEKRNQSMIVCGESGSGKTENAKHIMRYLCFVQKSSSSQIEDQVLQSNPIFEAFGNAKTLWNNNSSRFGKFTKMLIGNDNRVAGAICETYLLEKSRVVRQNKGERNFHVFYQVVGGLPSDQRKEWGLQGGAQSFHYLNQSGSYTADGIDDIREYDTLVKAMNTMKIESSEQQQMFRVIAAILHLGNVNFAAKGKDECIIDEKSNSHIQIASILFGIEPKNLQSSLLTRNIKVKGTVIVKPFNKIDAGLNRDAIAKSMYLGLFEHVVKTLNNTMYQGETNKWIGVLDVFGFEFFEHNSFEQLCINYANERLQQYFNEQTLLSEQKEYTREQLIWTKLKVPDLTKTIDLISSKNRGMFSLLDSACIMPEGNDDMFLELVFNTFPKSDIISRARYVKPKNHVKGTGDSFAKMNGFKIVHYAATVTYDAKEFLTKNTDQVHQDTITLFEKSKNPWIKNFFMAGVKQKLRQSIGTHFTHSVDNLIITLSKTNPHFIRCLNPNNKKSAGRFDPQNVRHQLRCAGIVEAVTMLKCGFPSRIPYSEIKKHFLKLLQPKVPQNLRDRDFAEAIVITFGLERSAFQLGRTKIFFRTGQKVLLDQLFAMDLSKVTKLQIAQIRRFLIRKRIARMRAAVLAYVRFMQRLRGVRALSYFRMCIRVYTYVGQTFPRVVKKIRKRKREIAGKGDEEDDNIYSSVEVVALQDKVKLLQKELESKNKKETDIVKEKVRSQHQISQLQTQLADVLSENEKNYKKQQENWKKQQRTLEEDRLKLEQKMKKEKDAQLERSKMEATLKESEYAENQKKLKNELLRLQKNLSQATNQTQEEKQKLKSSITEAENKVKRSQQKYEDEKNAWIRKEENMMKTLEETERKYQNAIEEREEAHKEEQKRRREEHKQDQERLSNSVTNLQEQLREAERRRKQETEEKEQLLGQKEKKFKDDIEKQRREVNDLQQKHQNEQERLKKQLESMKDMMHDSEHQSKGEQSKLKKAIQEADRKMAEKEAEFMKQNNLLHEKEIEFEKKRHQLEQKYQSEFEKREREYKKEQQAKERAQQNEVLEFQNTVRDLESQLQRVEFEKEKEKEERLRQMEREKEQEERLKRDKEKARRLKEEKVENENRIQNLMRQLQEAEDSQGSQRRKLEQEIALKDERSRRLEEEKEREKEKLVQERIRIEEKSREAEGRHKREADELQNAVSRMSRQLKQYEQEIEEDKKRSDQELEDALRRKEREERRRALEAIREAERAKAEAESEKFKQQQEVLKMQEKMMELERKLKDAEEHRDRERESMSVMLKQAESEVRQVKAYQPKRRKRIAAGWLVKAARYFGESKRRFFVLYDDKQLSYFGQEPRSNMAIQPLGHIDLQSAVTFTAPSLDKSVEGQRFTFDIVCNDRTWVFSALSDREWVAWCQVLRQMMPSNEPEFTTVKEGWLLKEGGLVKNWKKRWFCLANGVVFYFESEKECHRFKRSAQLNFSRSLRECARGYIKLSGSKLGANRSYKEQPYCFAIWTAERTFRLAGSSSKEVDDWLKATEGEMRRVKQDRVRRETWGDTMKMGVKQSLMDQSCDDALLSRMSMSSMISTRESVSKDARGYRSSSAAPLVGGPQHYRSRSSGPSLSGRPNPIMQQRESRGASIISGYTDSDDPNVPAAPRRKNRISSVISGYTTTDDPNVPKPPPRRQTRGHSVISGLTTSDDPNVPKPPPRSGRTSRGSSVISTYTSSDDPSVPRAPPRR